METVGALLILAVIFGPLFICARLNRKYNSKEHCNYDKKTLRDDAKIIDIKTKKVGLKGEHVFRTTVYFDDGFEYISHLTETGDFGPFAYTISVPYEMKQKIIDLAIDSHKMAIESYKERGMTKEEQEAIEFDEYIKSIKR